MIVTAFDRKKCRASFPTARHLLIIKKRKRVMRIELTYPAWKAGVLPLNYTRVISDTIGILSYNLIKCKNFF